MIEAMLLKTMGMTDGLTIANIQPIKVPRCPKKALPFSIGCVVNSYGLKITLTFVVTVLVEVGAAFTVTRTVLVDVFPLLSVPDNWNT